MDVGIGGFYLGERQIELIHQLSGAKIITESFPSGQGQERNFSPTDLVAAALISCILMVIAVVAGRSNIDVAGMKGTVRKVGGDKPGHISQLISVVHLPRNLSGEERSKLERSAHACPVHAALNPAIQCGIEFVYDL